MEEEATSITSWVTNSLGGLKREIVDTLTSRDSSARWLESIVKGVLKEKEENRMLDPAGWGLDGHKEVVKEDKENEEDKKDKKEKEDKEDKEDKEEVGENDERCIVLTWRCLSQVFIFNKAKLTINSDDDSFLHILKIFTTEYCFLLLRKPSLHKSSFPP